MNRQDALNILKTNLKSKWGDSLRIQYKESDDIWIFLCRIAGSVMTLMLL
jgi:hypothetical protein